MSASKRKGTRWEVRVVEFLAANGHPLAERRVSNGVNDRGDLAGVPGWVVEMKNCARVELSAWMDEAEREAKKAGVSRWAVVFPRRSCVTAKAFAVVPLWLLAELMRDDMPAVAPTGDAA